MFQELEKINTKPKPFEFYTASELWTEDHTSEMMLACHLNGDIDVSSRNTNFINRSVEWIVDYFNIKEEIKIADFGCGPGLYSSRLAQKKVHVTGIDFSKNSIQYAENISHKENLSINYINQNYLDFESDDRFDLIIMIMCDFCALSPEQRKIMLKKFHTLLEPDGHILLDVYSLNAFNEREETAIYETNLLSGFWSKEKYYGFLNTFKYEQDKVILDKYTIIEKSRTRTIYNWLQYFSQETLEKEFSANGFEIESYFSDVAGTPFDSQSKEFAVVTCKK